MRLAVMQPYIFPYLGYFHLIDSVDKFVFLDDVSYINRGWINRNRLCLNGKDYLFTIPLKKASQNKKIVETTIHDNYILWLNNFYKTFTSCYMRESNFEKIKSLVFDLLNSYGPGDSIADLAQESVIVCYEYLQSSIYNKYSSQLWLRASNCCKNNQHLKKENRLIAICKQEKSSTYHNAIGGQTLYNKEFFAKEGVSLSFVKSELSSYKKGFIPGLSIIDLLVSTTKIDTLQQQLKSYSLV